jgi:hypothetical protein
VDSRESKLVRSTDQDYWTMWISPADLDHDVLGKVYVANASSTYATNWSTPTSAKCSFTATAIKLNS